MWADVVMLLLWKGQKSVGSDKRDVQVKLVPFQMTSLKEDFGLAGIRDVTEFELYILYIFT